MQVRQPLCTRLARILVALVAALLLLAPAGADGLISRPVNTTDTFYTFDPLGNVSEMGSNVVAYDAYGQIRSGSNSTPFGHGGRYGCYRDSETGLECLGYRYYDPATGPNLQRRR
jgi:hypothetical protein